MFSVMRTGRWVGCYSLILAAAGAPLSQLLLMVESRCPAAPHAAREFRLVLSQACVDQRALPTPLKNGAPRADGHAAKGPLAPAKPVALLLLKPISDHWDTPSVASLDCAEAPPAGVTHLDSFGQVLPPHASTSSFCTWALAPPQARGPPRG
jgi:hypothetical protein